MSVKKNSDIHFLKSHTSISSSSIKIYGGGFFVFLPKQTHCSKQMPKCHLPSVERKREKATERELPDEGSRKDATKLFSSNKTSGSQFSARTQAPFCKAAAENKKKIYINLAPRKAANVSTFHEPI